MIDWVKSIQGDYRFEQQYKWDIGDDTFFIFRDNLSDGYCIMSFTPVLLPDPNFPNDVIKLMAVWTPEPHRNKGIGTRCVLSCKAKLDEVNEGEQEIARILLFPVPFRCCWKEGIKFNGTEDMCGWADDSGHYGHDQYFPESCHIMKWKELRDWYAKMGWKETKKKHYLQGMSMRSRSIGRLPMIYPYE